MKKYSLFAVGFPLADVIIHGVGEDIYDQFNLPKDGTVLGSAGLFDRLLAEYGQTIDKLTMGGSALNTLRVFRAASNYTDESLASFVGSAGDDCVAKEMKSKLETSEGIHCQFQTIPDPEFRSGCCFSLPSGDDRCMVTFPSASRQMTVDYVRSALANLGSAGCEGVFIVSYLFNISAEIVETIAEQCSKQNVPILLSLSSPLMCSIHAQNILKILLLKPNLVKLVIGNRSEVETLVRTLNGNANMKLEECVAWLAEPGRVIIATCGQDRKILACESVGKVHEFAQMTNSDNMAADATAAGDAFAGGFLAKFLRSEPLVSCVDSGFHWASEIVKKSGCQIPDKDSNITPCKNKTAHCSFCSKIIALKN